MHESIREIARSRNKLNEKLSAIAEFEDSMRELKIGYEFKLEVEKGKFLSWEKNGDSKLYRLFLHDPQHDPPFVALRQTNVKTRLYYLKYIDDFIKAFENEFTKLLDSK